MSTRDHQNNRSRQVRIRLLAIAFVLTVLLAPILILTSAPDVQSAAAAGANNASISLDGPNKSSPGETISYDIKTDAVGLYGLQLEIKYDPAVLQAPGAQLTSGSCPLPDFVVYNVIDNGSGTISYAATSLAPTPPCDGGIVASFQFEVLPNAAGGNTAVQFDSVILADIDGKEIPATAVDLALEIADTKADFNGAPTTGVAPLVVFFTNLSTGDYNKCTWNFGDNSANYSCANPIHTYTTAGQFTVSLLISNPSGSRIETKVDYIIVTEQYDLYLPVIVANYP